DFPARIAKLPKVIHHFHLALQSGCSDTLRAMRRRYNAPQAAQFIENVREVIPDATLSFLGLGVKYPFASWGSIINSATNIAVMTHYWFMWIPAGILILITVLGFNFVGDGLRDAFDPRMKR
ncbi:MAG: hypothetical protein MJ141_07080, partial [Clostridia bacterium]|nr:hypothetical protein [Clostridia bacterium]